MFAAHLRVIHLSIAHLIHRVLLAAGLSQIGGVRHPRLVSAHVFPVPLRLVLHFVLVARHCSGSAIACALALAVMFGQITVSYVPRFISSFSSTAYYSLLLALR
jgi:hypothetical protein